MAAPPGILNIDRRARTNSSAPTREYGVMVGDMRVSPPALASYFLRLDDISRRVVSGGFLTTGEKLNGHPRRRADRLVDKFVGN